MKRVLFEYLPSWLLLIIFGLIVLHAPLIVAVGSHWPSLALGIKAWKELLMIIALVLLAVAVTQRGQWRTLLKDNLIRLMLAFAVLHGGIALLKPVTWQSLVAGLSIDLRYLLYFCLVYVFLALYPRYKQQFITIGIAGALVVLGFTCLQLVLPHDALKYLGYSSATIEPYITVDKNPDFVRFNSTLRGPNPLGAYALIVLVGVVAFGMKYGRTVRDQRMRWLHAFLAVGSIIALWVSYSRSAWIGAAVGILTVVGTRYGKHLDAKKWSVVAVFTVLLVVGSLLLKDSSFFRTVILHDSPTTGATVDSNTAHAASLGDGLNRMLAQPLGTGVGSTGSASLMGGEPLIIENHYLFVAHEVGWLGLGLFISIMIVALRRLWARRADWLALTLFGSGIGLSVVGLLLPVWVDDTVSIIWWGMAAVVLAKGETHGTTNKKATRTA